MYLTSLTCPCSGKEAKAKQRTDSGDKANAGQQNGGQQNPRERQDKLGNDSASVNRNPADKQNKQSDTDMDNEEESGETRANPRAPQPPPHRSGGPTARAGNRPP